MEYKEELTKAMTMLAQDERTVFIGQSVRYSGHAMFNTLKDVPMEKRIELPVFEDTQMGMSIGMAMVGMIPISIYPRMDFLLCAMNQLVNHLAVMKEMSNGQFNPRVIIRTALGSNIPFKAGAQHGKDIMEPLRMLCHNGVAIVRLRQPELIVQEYKYALKYGGSAILIEEGDLYG
uniref:Putative transketolase domain containing protein n=1 Tax=viral metagenome TaxID=1070528 RepID=A0A6M3LAS5_9ZZZZ